MPLVKREIEPVYLSRGLITPQGVTNELECVTNCTLSAIIRQLSNLGKHAEDIFGELYNEANLLYKRSNMLQDRIDRLSVKVTQLDATRDQESMEGYTGQTPYHNTFRADQIILDTGTLPPALQETRARCDPVPPLGLLDPYRDDGREALKFYTNPKYFFELWCQEMQKNITDIREKRRGKKRQRGSRGHQASGPRQIKTRRDQWQQQAMGKDLMPINPPPVYTPTQTPTSETGGQITVMSDGDSSQESMQNTNHLQHQHQQLSLPEEYGSRDHRRQSNRPHSRPPPPPSNDSTPTDEQARPVVNGIVHRPVRPAPTPPIPTSHQNHLPPAPPPPMMMMQDHMAMDHQQFPHPPSEPMDVSQPNHIPMPPPLPPSSNMSPYPNSQPQQMPPPPPMPDPNVPPPPPPPPTGFSAGQPLPQPPPGPPAANIPAPPPPPPPGGISHPPSSTPPTSDPISSSPPANTISPTRRTSQRPTPPREPDGRSDLLRAIEKGINLRKVEVKEAKERTAMPNSVEAILARRIAVELSDSEDGSYSDGSEDEDWS